MRRLDGREGAEEASAEADGKGAALESADGYGGEGGEVMRFLARDAA